VDTHAEVHVAAAVDQVGRVLGTLPAMATPRAPSASQGVAVSERGRIPASVVEQFESATRRS